MGIPVAVQMYTMRKESEQDFIGVLEKAASLGYQGIEFAGYGNLSPEEVKKTLDGLGLQAASSHISLERLQEDLQGVIHDQHILGSRHIVCPYLLPEKRTEKDYFELIRLLNEAGETCQKEGITLSYHNHDFELVRLSNGKTALETILDETNPEWVKAEFDVYWLTRAGEDPVKWLERYKGRTPLVHLKDMTTDGEQFFAELGTGGVNLEAVLQQGEASHVQWWIVEQDQCRRPPFESIEISLNYLKKAVNQ
jgi:sugar phosphate isomerase/epimerase